MGEAQRSLMKSLAPRSVTVFTYRFRQISLLRKARQFLVVSSFDFVSFFYQTKPNHEITLKPFEKNK